MKQLLIAHLNKLIDDLAKKHYVSKEQIRISYEFYQFYYYVDNNLYDTYYRAKKSIKNKKQYIKTISL